MSVRIHELLVQAIEQGASDIHLSSGEVPCLRINGEVVRLDLPPLGPDDAKRLAYSVMTEKQKVLFEKRPGGGLLDRAQGPGAFSCERL
jgi:twitching motility protein PilT